MNTTTTIPTIKARLRTIRDGLNTLHSSVAEDGAEVSRDRVAALRLELDEIGYALSAEDRAPDAAPAPLGLTLPADPEERRLALGRHIRELADLLPPPKEVVPPPPEEVVTLADFVDEAGHLRNAVFGFGMAAEAVAPGPEAEALAHLADHATDLADALLAGLTRAHEASTA